MSDVNSDDDDKNVVPVKNVEQQTQDLLLKIDHTKKPVELDGNIETMRDSFLNAVSTETYNRSRGDLAICILEPGRQFASLTWCPEFSESKAIIGMKKNGLPNNLDSILHYRENVNLPPLLALAALEGVRVILKPSAIHMVDASALEPSKCKIIFKFD
jgi:hypothetical protein